MNAIDSIRKCLRRFCIVVLVTACALTELSAAPKTDEENAKLSTALTPEGGRIVVDLHGLQPIATPLFSAHVDQTVRFGRDEILGEATVKIHVVQGHPSVFTLGLSSDEDIVDVSGAKLRDWAVRRGAGIAAGQRFVDFHPLLKANLPEPQDFEWLVRTHRRVTAVPSAVSVLLFTKGEAVGFSSQVSLRSDPSLAFQIKSFEGLVPTGDDSAHATPIHFIGTGAGRLEVFIHQPGGVANEAELSDTQLTAKLLNGEHSADFRFSAQFHAEKIGARLRLLSGLAALTDQATGEGWHVELVGIEKNHTTYDLVADRIGTMPVELSFAAQVIENGDWRTFDFTMPAGAAVSLLLNGWASDVSFKADAPIVPASANPGWKGFLPADGAAAIAWKHSRAAAEGTLFFTSEEQSDVRVGAGLLRESSTIALRVLQGKLNGVRCRLEGVGEILSVEGVNIVSWKVLPESSGRVLDIRFSRPVETAGTVVVVSQTGLGEYPVKVAPLRLVPEKVVRHSGYLRVANSGAVRLEIAESTGLLQLAPNQFPGAALEDDARQVFVYRFPSADYTYQVRAKQIQPEIGVSAIETYELAETDRVIAADLELDVREAALRDWSLSIPDDYTVATLTGSGVADYAVETETVDGYRKLRVLFNQDVEGRQLVSLRLEKNQTASAGNWALRPLRFPEAKSVRGSIGVVTTPGYRIVPTEVGELTEVPLSYFPKQTAGLQQAWRFRDADWSAEVRVDALRQSVEADVFHLYSIKRGLVYGSVLLNYFVVGAPATEWRVEVPTSLGNIDVVGENIRRDWRREGNQVIVSLHQPVLGAATVLLTFEQPLSARGGTITPGEIRPLGVQSERGLIEVASSLQVKSELQKAEGGGLLPLDILELPAEFRLLANSPALAIYQYTDRPFRLEMGVQWFTPAETVDQVVDFAKLSSMISRDGQVVTDAQYFVKTRGTKALRLVIPDGMKLWETHADGELVTARSDGAQTIVPLPAKANPNEPVTVALKLGQASAGDGAFVKLLAPRTLATTVIDEWILHPDEGRMLLPRGGSAKLVMPVMPETGFEWIARHAPVRVAWLFLAVATAAFCLRRNEGWVVLVGFAFGAIALANAGILTATAEVSQRPNFSALTYAATLVPSGESVSIQVANVTAVDGVSGGWGATIAICGVGLLLIAFILRKNRRRAVWFLSVMGVLFLAGGLLGQPGGAGLFFGAIAAGIVGLMVAGGTKRFRNAENFRRKRPPIPPGPAIGSNLALGLLLGLIGLGLAAPRMAQGQERSVSKSWIQEGLKPAQAIVQHWVIREDRLFGEFDITVRGGPGDSFLLLRSPALLTDFKGDGLRMGKLNAGDATAYYVAPEREGVFTAHVRFEMPVKDRSEGLALPTGAAVIESVNLELDQAGWEFVSPSAVQVVPTLGLIGQRSGATLIFAPQAVSVIKLQPKQRDIAAEATRFFVEAANLYLPGPGVVDGKTRFTVRPVQGRVAELLVDVPKGLTISDVKGGPVSVWRFDPQERKLRVSIEPAQTETFSFEVESQLSAAGLPFDLSLEPLRLTGAEGEEGMLALAFAGETQPEAIRPTDLSSVNVQDFDAELLPSVEDETLRAVIQQVWRYGATGGQVNLKVAAIEPEVRVVGRHLISLDDDRLLLSVDLNVAITRAGIFRLSFAVPDGLEIEALTGSALSQWTEAPENGRRIVTLHLTGRTLGSQNFSVTLAGPAPHAQAAWSIPRLSLREATRQTGEAIVVPGKGLRLQTVAREKVTELDPHAVGSLQPGSLAFRLLQDDWSIHLGIEALEPWVTVQMLEETTLRDGQTMTRLALHYRVENAAVKQVRLKIPGLTEEGSRTVRATGVAVSDVVKIAGEPELWEIRFQRGVAGETDVQIEFQEMTAREESRERVSPPVFIGARQVTQFVAVRGSGRLELEAVKLPRGWTRSDWSSVPIFLQDRNDRSVPALCFGVAEPESALIVTVRRHEVAEALKLQVTEANLTTLLSTTMGSLTAVDLKLDVLEKTRFRVRLPEKAQLFNMLVNGEGVDVVREEDAYSFHVAASLAAEQTATVHFVYAVPSNLKWGDLAGPVLSVPLQNVTWRVVVPTGFELKDHQGGFVLHEERVTESFGIEDYQSLVSATHSAEAKKGAAWLDEANDWLQRGDQEKAGEMFSRASNAQGLDEASNEDARVQLRRLKTQQTVLGLNTRRQRLYLDNRLGAAKNEQLELAANLNPFMRGAVNFDPQQLDQLLLGNTTEETAALKGIASRLVDQQLAPEPAPIQLDVKLSERGRVFTFTRSLEVESGAGLILAVTTKSISIAPWPTVAWLLLGTLLIAAIAFGPQMEPKK